MPRFRTVMEAATYYGFKRRRFEILAAIGRKAGDLMPSQTPSEMPGWWDRMKVLGLLAYRCPQQVVDRATESGMASEEPVREIAPSAPPKPGKRVAVAAKASVGPPVEEETERPRGPRAIQLWSGEEAPIEEMVAQERQLLQTFHSLYVDEITTNGIGTPLATALATRRKELQASVQALMKSVKHFREEEEWVKKEDVAVTAGEFAVALAQIIRAEIPRQFPREDQERIHLGLDAAALRIQDALSATFRAA